jgi:hypothetical protein
MMQETWLVHDDRAPSRNSIEHSQPQAVACSSLYGRRRKSFCHSVVFRGADLVFSLG